MAFVFEPRVRVTSETEGSGEIVLGPELRGSNGFRFVMDHGDTCDAVISYDNVFEEFEATFSTEGGGYGKLIRGTCFRSQHANGTRDKNHVSLPPGVKTVIMTVAASRAATLRGGLRFDVVQTLTNGEQAQLQANIGGVFAAGTRLLFQQSVAPTGWMKDVTYNEHALRITSGAVTNGGSHNFSTIFANTVTGGRALTINQLPIFTPSFSIVPAYDRATQVSVSPTDTNGDGSTNGRVTAIQHASTGTTGGTFNSIGSGAAHDHPIDMRVRYVDAIICQKMPL
jgi:hypothetical protein